jgi:hypothetical protein
LRRCRCGDSRPRLSVERSSTPSSSLPTNSATTNEFHSPQLRVLRLGLLQMGTSGSAFFQSVGKSLEAGREPRRERMPTLPVSGHLRGVLFRRRHRWESRPDAADAHGPKPNNNRDHENPEPKPQAECLFAEPHEEIISPTGRANQDNFPRQRSFTALPNPGGTAGMFRKNLRWCTYNLTDCARFNVKIPALSLQRAEGQGGTRTGHPQFALTASH